MAVVLHHSKAKGTRKLVLIGIANHEGDGGAWPSMATLATYANVDERNARKAVEWLRDHRELAVDVQGGGDLHTADHARPNRYRVLVSCPPWCDRTTSHRDTRRLSGGRQRALFSTPVDKPVHPRTNAPGGLSTGGTNAPGGGGTDAPPEPSIEPTPPLTPQPQLQDTRACAECGLPASRCVPQQLAYPTEDRHTYTPRPRP